MARYVLVLGDAPVPAGSAPGSLGDELPAVLASGGLRLERVETGGAALEHAQSGSPPAAVLVDLDMPRHGGWVFLGKRLAIRSLASVPTVTCSAEPDLALVVASLGVAMHLAKPLRAASLRLALQEAKVVESWSSDARTYSIYARFRSRRLALRKRIVSFEAAVRALEALRSERFHGQQNVFLVDDATGEAVP